MAAWIRAADVPRSWEGKQLWRWNAWSNREPFVETLPRNFSRKPKHCIGVWFRKYKVPSPPKIK